MTTDAVQLGTDATEEAVKIGIKAINNVPKILEEKVSFAQGVGKTIEETSGQVKEVHSSKKKSAFSTTVKMSFLCLFSGLRGCVNTSQSSFSFCQNLWRICRWQPPQIL